MKRILLAALGGVTVAALGIASPSHAASIDFGVVPLGGTLVYTGATLQASTAFDFDASTLTVNQIGAGDSSGLAVGGNVTLTPTDLMYGTLTGPLGANSFTKKWTDPSGTFTESITSVEAFNRASANAITVDFAGTLTSTNGVFTNSPAFLIFNANQAAGPGGSIAASFTETSVNPTIPEPSTWAMLLTGFAGLGLAGLRSRRRQRLQSAF